MLSRVDASKPDSRCRESGRSAVCEEMNERLVPRGKSWEQRPQEWVVGLGLHPPGLDDPDGSGEEFLGAMPGFRDQVELLDGIFGLAGATAKGEVPQCVLALAQTPLRGQSTAMP